MIELISEEDVATKHTYKGIYARNISNVRQKDFCRRNKISYKQYRSRGNKRCFICGTADDYNGHSWVEYYDGNGKRNVRHYLCKDCRDGINGMIWLD